jgi:hypothetical protein
VPQAADNAPSILVISDGCNVGLKSAQGRVKAHGGLVGNEPVDTGNGVGSANDPYQVGRTNKV